MRSLGSVLNTNVATNVAAESGSQPPKGKSTKLTKIRSFQRKFSSTGCSKSLRHTMSGHRYYYGQVRLPKNIMPANQIAATNVETSSVDLSTNSEGMSSDHYSSDSADSSYNLSDSDSDSDTEFVVSAEMVS